MINTKKSRRKEKLNNFALALYLIHSESYDVDTDTFAGEIKSDSELWGKNDPSFCINFLNGHPDRFEEYYYAIK